MNGRVFVLGVSVNRRVFVLFRCERSCICARGIDVNGRVFVLWVIDVNGHVFVLGVSM